MEMLAGLGWDEMGGPGGLVAALGLIKSNIALSISFNLALIALQFDRWILNNRIMLTAPRRGINADSCCATTKGMMRHEQSDAKLQPSIAQYAICGTLVMRIHKWIRHCPTDTRIMRHVD